VTSQGDPEPPPATPVSTVIDLIGKVGSPLAIGSSLLYYFGWVRTVTQARLLGYDATLVGFSVEDYILKSVNVLFIPLIALLLAFAGLVAVDQVLARKAKASPAVGAILRVAGLMLRYAWVVLIPAGVAMTFFRVPGSFFAVPCAITVAMCGVLYASRIDRHLGEPPRSALAGRIVVLTLLTLAVFWLTERLAQTMGQAFAADLIHNPDQLTSVSVLSKQNLGIASSCVSERRVGTGDGDFTFRYDGLRLLQAANDRQFLLSVCSGVPRVFVLSDGEGIRMEYAAASVGIRTGST